MPYLLRQSVSVEDGKNEFNGLTTKLGLFNWAFITITFLCCVLNILLIHAHKLRLLPLVPYMILIGCLTYSVCKIKKIVQENAVHFNNRSKRMCSMITLFFAYAAQMAITAPVSIEYEAPGITQEGYRKLDVVFIIQMIFSFLIGSIIQIFVIYMMFQMIDHDPEQSMSTPESQVTMMLKTSSTVKNKQNNSIQIIFTDD